MRAIILAAGRGSRLGAGSRDTPKCLLEVGRKRLIEHQLEALSEAGVGPVLMVLGYCADEIREVVGIQAEYVVSTRWSSTNSIYSFWLARDWLSGPTLVLNSDVLLHPDIIDRILKMKGDCIAFDSSSGDGWEHMKVEIEDTRLLGMSKELPPERTAGENVGLLRFTEETANRLFAHAGEMIENGHEKDWLGSAVCALAKERPIGTADIAGLPWGEIDFPYDLVRARKEVWPAIRRDRSGRRLVRRLTQGACTMAFIAAFAYLAFNTWVSPAESTWDLVDAKATESVEIRSGDQVRQWSRLRQGESTELRVRGPTHLRLDSRLLTAADAPRAEEPYVIEVVLDGKRLDWFKEKGIPSGTWTHQEFSVCKRRRLELDIPEGEHVIAVRLVAALSRECLTRVSRKEEAVAID